MSKTLIGIVSYGGLPFLRVLLDEIQRAVETPVDVVVIIAKPDDTEMVTALDSRLNTRLMTRWHGKNLGFAASINDLYDAAFVEGSYDNLIICGNDIVPMPGAIDAMIRTADSTDYEMVCGSEFNARFLCDRYPEARRYFHGDNLVFTDFGARPWMLHKDFREGIEPDTRKDIRNMTLFKRSSFEKVGYDDVNFWPNGYFADNDYGRRCDLLGVSACGLKEAAFFHFTSRTIHQNAQRDHGGYFNRNRIYYTHKWHGEPGQEKLATPFGGGPYVFVPCAKSNVTITVPADMKIATRDHEAACIEYWATR